MCAITMKIGRTSDSRRTRRRVGQQRCVLWWEARFTPFLDSADCTIVTPLQLSLRQLCLSESTLNCPIRTAPASFRRRPSPWIGVTSGWSNESRINRLTHQAEEKFLSVRDVLTTHRCAVSTNSTKSSDQQVVPV